MNFSSTNKLFITSLAILGLSHIFLVFAQDLVEVQNEDQQ